MAKIEVSSNKLKLGIGLFNSCRTNHALLAIMAFSVFFSGHASASPNSCVQLFLAQHAGFSESVRSKMRQAISRHGLAIAINKNAAGDLNSTELMTEIYSDIPVHVVQEGGSHADVPQAVFHGFRSGVSKVSTPFAIGLSPEKNGRTKSKVDDLILARAVDPAVMPETFLGSELKVDTRLIEQSRLKLRLGFENGNFEQVMIALSEVASYLGKTSLEVFPNGAIFKLADDVKTGDVFGLLTSDNLQELLSKTDLQKVLNMHAYMGKITFEKFISILQGRKSNALPVDRIFNLLADFLIVPDQVLVQEIISIDKVVGRNIEIRVDFVNGVAVSAAPRYGYAYLPDLHREAEAFVNQFLFKARERFPSLSGGVDIVRLKDGRLKILEFNLGDRSGFRLPRVEPIYANQFLSSLQGKPTRMLERFNLISDLPASKQKQYLQTFSRTKLNRTEKESDIYVAEVLAYFRNRAIDRYRSGHVSFPDRLSVIQYVSQLIKSIRNPNQALQSDLDEIYKTSQAYFDQDPI